jgi:hypothetical protein
MSGKKIILDLCGGTGSWSRPYKEAGYDVRVVTLPDKDVRYYSPPDNVYGILAAPPCTMFSRARTTAVIPRDLWAGMSIVEACLRIVWQCRYKNRLGFWAIENPMGILRQFLGRPGMSFQPWEYGDGYVKQTDLWGWFKIPTKHPVPVSDWMREQVRKGSRNGKALPALPSGYVVPKGERADQIRRAITPAGFAKAFFAVNK